jgi:hypothetical protein
MIFDFISYFDINLIRLTLSNIDDKRNNVFKVYYSKIEIFIKKSHNKETTKKEIKNAII